MTAKDTLYESTMGTNLGPQFGDIVLINNHYQCKYDCHGRTPVLWSCGYPRDYCMCVSLDCERELPKKLFIWHTYEKDVFETASCSLSCAKYYRESYEETLLLGKIFWPQAGFEPV